MHSLSMDSLSRGGDKRLDIRAEAPKTRCPTPIAKVGDRVGTAGSSYFAAAAIFSRIFAISSRFGP